MCVSGAKKCLFFGKFGALCFRETPVLRFTLLPYYRCITLLQHFFFINMTPLENPLPLECILKIKENQKHCKGGATRAQNFIHPSYQYIHTLLTTPRDIFGDSSIRIPDPWEKSTSKKMFGIVFSLVTSKKGHCRGWSKVARALVLKSMYPSPSQKYPFVPRISLFLSRSVLLFSGIAPLFSRIAL